MPIRSNLFKGKEIVKPASPPSESASEEYSDEEQAKRDKKMQKSFTLIEKHFKNIYRPTNNNLRTSLNTRNKNVDTSPRTGNDRQTGKTGSTLHVHDQNGNVVNENVQENVGNVIVNGNQVGCSYKEFLDCNPKEYDGKRCDVVLTRWIEKIESVQDMSGCSVDQKVKYIAGSFVEEFCPNHEMQKLETELWNHVMVRAGHAAYTDRFHELARLVPHLVTPESRMIERYVYGLAPQIRGMVGSNGAKDYIEGCADFWCTNPLGGCLGVTSMIEASMSPPICRKYKNSIAIATGCKRFKNTKRSNRKIRIPIAISPEEVDGQMVGKVETKIIAKNGTITKVPEKFKNYETSDEETEEQPRRRDLYRFVDHPQIQQANPMNEFAPHQIPQPLGNMNGWLI
ncbi:hypothetical protein Tco_0457574, partial [Tanacetum coccineum]